jgi:hypothetical protein
MVGTQSIKPAGGQRAGAVVRCGVRDAGCTGKGIRRLKIRALERNMVRTLCFAAILAVVPWAGVNAQNSKQLSKAEASLVAADSARYRAMVNKDIKALGLLLADELVYIHSTGVRQSKSEHMHDIEREGGAVYRRLDTKEQVPSIYGNTGLIQGVVVFNTGGPGHESAFTLRYTSVYVRRQNRWQLVSFSCSRLPEDGAAGPRAGGASSGVLTAPPSGVPPNGPTQN